MKNIDIYRIKTEQNKILDKSILLNVSKYVVMPIHNNNDKIIVVVAGINSNAFI